MFIIYLIFELKLQFTHWKTVTVYFLPNGAEPELNCYA